MKNVIKKIGLVFVILSLSFLISCKNEQKVYNTNNSIEDKKIIELDSKELFKNKNARLAFAYAIDKEYIINVLLKDGSSLANYFVPKNICYDSEGKDFRSKYPDGFISFDENKAKEYWKKAKEELKFDTVKLEFLTYDQEDRKKISEYIQSQLMKNLEGVEITLNIQPFKNKISLCLAGKFDIEFTGWGGSYPDPLAYLSCYFKDNTFNLSGYDSDEYNDELNDCRIGKLAAKSDERLYKMQELEKKLVGEDVQIIPLFQRGVSTLKRKGLTGFEQKPLQSDVFKYAETDVQTNGKNIIRMISRADLPTLDSIKANDTVSSTVIANVFDTLLEFDDKNELRPLAAEKFEKNEDGSKYIFYLRKDAKWSNGVPVTARDFEFAFKLLADLNSGAQYSDMLITAGIKNAKQILNKELENDKLGVNAIDDYTLEIELDYPNVLFEKLMTLKTFCPINEEFYNSHKDKYGTTVEDTLYNGAYIMEKWDTGYGYSFIKNPNYWNKDNVKNDGVSYRVIKDVAAGVNLYEKGEIDVCPLSGEFIDTYSENPEFHSFLDSGIMYLVLNVNKR